MNNEKYKTNYLTNVILNIQLPSVFLFNDKTLPKFQKSIEKEFKILQEGKEVKINHTINPQTQSIDSVSEEKRIWKFFNEDKSRILQITDNNLIVEFLKYSHFPDFQSVVGLALDSFKEIYKDFSSIRLGLRYINLISLEGDPFDWENYLNKDLYGGINFYQKKENLTRLIYVSEIAEDDYRLNIQTGFANSLYPGQIVKKEFMLDYDCYTTETLDYEQMITRTNEFNSVITQTFESSIEDGLRKEMRK